MEVAAAENKEQRGKGRVGTLENPETYANVPGHIIPIIEREFDDFDNEAEQFLSGQLEENQFIGFRLKQGVYGQRQPDVQMIRIKLPFGGVTPEQMDAFASVVEKYAPLDKGHITTRQNIQIHHVPLRDTELLLREIAPGPKSTYILATGAFALAWLVGFLVVIAPAGAGVREVTLVFLLQSAATGPQALSLALVSRFLMTAADAIGFAVGVAIGRGRPASAPDQTAAP